MSPGSVRQFVTCPKGKAIQSVRKKCEVERHIRASVPPGCFEEKIAGVGKAWKCNQKQARRGEAVGCLQDCRRYHQVSPQPSPHALHSQILPVPFHLIAHWGKYLKIRTHQDTQNTQQLWNKNGSNNKIKTASTCRALTDLSAILSALGLSTHLTPQWPAAISATSSPILLIRKLRQLWISLQCSFLLSTALCTPKFICWISKRQYDYIWRQGPWGGTRAYMSHKTVVLMCHTEHGTKARS